MRKNNQFRFLIRLTFIYLVFLPEFLYSADYQWMKGDTIWAMNQTVPKVTNASMLGDDKYITYSSDSTIRIWDIQSGNIIRSRKLEGVAERVVFSHDGKYFIVSHLIIENYSFGTFNKFDFLFELYESESLSLLSKFNMRDTIFSKYLISGGPESTYKGILLSVFNFERELNKIYIFFDAGIYGYNGAQEVNSSGGLTMQLNLTNNNFSIDIAKKTSQIHKLKLNQSDYYSVHYYYLSFSPGSSNYSSVYSIASGLVKINYDSLVGENLFDYQYSYREYLGKIEKNSYYELKDYYFNKNQLLFWGYTDGNYSLSEYKIQSKEHTTIKDFRYYTPFFFTPNGQYLVFYRSRYKEVDYITFFNPNSKSDEINIPVSKESDQNFMLLSKSENLIVHISNTDKDSYQRVYDLNKILKRIDFSIGKRKIQIGESVKLEGYFDGKYKEISWLVNGMVNKSTELGINYTPKDMGFYDITLTITDENGKIYNLKKEKYLEVQDSVIADFKSENNYGKAPLEVKFTNLSRGADLNYLWDFGDKTTSTEKNPVHIYKDSGYYHVKLIVENDLDNDTILRSFEVVVGKLKPKLIHSTNKKLYDHKGPLATHSDYNKKHFNSIELDAENNILLFYNQIVFSGGSWFYENLIISKFNNNRDLIWNIDFTDATSKFNSLVQYKEKLFLFSPPYTRILNDSGNLIIDYLYKYNYVSNSVQFKNHLYFCHYIGSKNFLSCVDSNLEIIKQVTPLDSANKLFKSKNKLIQFSCNNYKQFYIRTYDNELNIISEAKIDENNIDVNNSYFDGINNLFLVINNRTANEIVRYNLDGQLLGRIILLDFNTINDILFHNDKIIVLGDFSEYNGFAVYDKNMKNPEIFMNYLPHPPYNIGIVKPDGNLVLIAYKFENNPKNEYYIEEIKLPYIPDLYSENQDIMPGIDELVINDDIIINEVKREKLSVLPSPAVDYITIQIQPTEGLQSEEGSEVVIYNSLGELVLKDVPHLQDVAHLRRIDISQLPVGLYFVKIGDKVEKFVKI